MIFDVAEVGTLLTLTVETFYSLCVTEDTSTVLHSISDRIVYVEYRLGRG